MYKRQVYAYAKLLEAGEIEMGENINVVVPTGCLLYTSIDSGLCTGCGLCSQICSVDAIETVK